MKLGRIASRIDMAFTTRDHTHVAKMRATRGSIAGRRLLRMPEPSGEDRAHARRPGVVSRNVSCRRCQRERASRWFRVG